MNTTKKTTIRCAIYTRKSCEEGLEQEFNSLDAQRDAGEAYIASQRHASWTLIAENYDDGGFSGGNMQRPALQRLLADIAAGKIDCVLVHRVDRLSRSLLDFAKMMEILDRHQVAFVSITQQFNSATSMGRLVLHVLLSFAQFEREIISERTRDKIAAARRKGIWSGGMPLLGYDVDEHGKLLVNQGEAEQVRAIFRLYLQHGSLRRVLQEIDRHGWRTKCWQTRKGHQRGGRPFTKSTLHQLLTNITNLGKVRHKHEAHLGEHPPIIDNDLWEQVQDLLNKNGRGEPYAHHHSDALLKGLLFCGLCHHAMTPAHSSVRHKKYHYYICTTRQKLGAQRCPSQPLPADKMEHAVLEQLHALAHDPARWHECLMQAQPLGPARLAELTAEKTTLAKELLEWKRETRRLAQHLASGKNGDATAISRLTDLQDQVLAGERRATELTEEIIALSRRQVTQEELSRTALFFDGSWRTMSRCDQARLLRHLLQRIDCAAGKITVTFNPAGIKTLAEELAHQETNP
jgi:site-specific DNA recombinase